MRIVMIGISCLTLGLLLALATFTLAGCGGGGSGGGEGSAALPSAPQATISGQVADGPIAGAAAQLFADAELTLPIGSAGTSTDTTGRFTITLPQSSLNGLTQVFVRARGGNDTETGETPGEFSGCAVISGPTTSAVRVHVTPLSSIIVRTLAADRDIDLELALGQVAELFGLAPSAFDLNPPRLLTNSGLMVASRVIIQASERAHGGVPGFAERVDRFLSELATGIVTGGPDTSVLRSANDDVERGGHGGGGVSIRPPTAFRLSQFDFGDKDFDISTAPILATTGALRNLALTMSVSVTSTAAVTGTTAVTGTPEVTSTAEVIGTTLPNIFLEVTGRSDFPAGSRYRGGFDLIVRGLGADRRSLSVSIKPFKLTAQRGQTTGELELLHGTSMTVTGVDASGNVTSEVRIENLGAAAPGVLTAVDVAGRTRLTLSPAAILAAVKARLLPAVQAGHPVGLLCWQAAFELFLRFQGFPLVNANGRVGQISLLQTAP